MKTYGWDDRLPDLPLDPPEPNYECGDCGFRFDIGKWSDHDCPKCSGDNIYKG